VSWQFGHALSKMIVAPETGGRAWGFCGWPHFLCTSFPVH